MSFKFTYTCATYKMQYETEYEKLFHATLIQLLKREMLIAEQQFRESANSEFDNSEVYQFEDDDYATVELYKKFADELHALIESDDINYDDCVKLIRESDASCDLQIES